MGFIAWQNTIASNWEKNAIIQAMLYKFTLLTIILFAPGFQAGQVAEEEYEIVRKNEKATLFERWDFFPGTTLKARHIKGVFQTSASLDKMFIAVTDEVKIREWQSHLAEYRHIPISDSTWYTYSLYDMPWPMSDQDYLFSYTLKKRTENTLVISFQYSSNEKLAPLRDDVDRRPSTGQWQFEKLSNGHTQVTYTIVSKPISYPRFITDRIVRNSLINTLNTLIEVAEKK